jgi:glycosyltransferase involved in cell wall biosynthesis
MRLLHITPSFYPAMVYGGPTRSVYELCRQLARIGCDVRVLTTDANGPHAVLPVATDRETELEERLVVRYCHRWMDVSVSPRLLSLLHRYIRWADVVHLMAVYSFPTIPTLLACRLLGKPVVWSPRGMLQRWTGTRRPALKLLWEKVCRAAAPKNLLLHFTADSEAEESRSRMPGVRSVVIPNGLSIPDEVDHKNGHSALRLVYLGRLDPIKGIENLLRACSMLNGSLGRAASLTIAGAGEGAYTRALEADIKRLGLSERVRMIGEVTDDRKRNLFAEADILVAPSFTENFGIVVAEALAHAVPVIASTGTPWKRVEEMEAGLWVDNSPESLAKAIEQMSRMPLREMGLRGREWMKEEFASVVIAERMLEAYRGIANFELRIAN